MQNDWLVVVVVAGSVVVGIVLVVMSVVVGCVSVDVELIVMVVIEVSVVVGDGQERSGKLLLSWRFTFAAAAPQPSRASPGCLFPVHISVFALD